MIDPKQTVCHECDESNLDPCLLRRQEMKDGHRWRCEGSGLFWNFRVLPHVHTFVHISSKLILQLIWNCPASATGFANPGADDMPTITKALAESVIHKSTTRATLPRHKLAAKLTSTHHEARNDTHSVVAVSRLL